MNQETSSTTAASAGVVEPERSATLLTVERDTTTTSYRERDDRPVPLPAPVRWVLGALVAVGGIAALTNVASDRIESTLEDRTDASLRAAGLDPTEFDVEFDFRDGTVIGSLPAGWSEDRLRTAIGVDGARRLVFELERSASSQGADS